MRIAKDLHLWCAFHLSKAAMKLADQRLKGVPRTSPYCRGDPPRAGKAARLFCCFLWRHHALKAPLSPLPSLWGYFSDAFDHGRMLPWGCCFKRIQDAPRQLAGGDRLPQGSSLLLWALHPLMALRLLQAAAHSLGVFSRARRSSRQWEPRLLKVSWRRSGLGAASWHSHEADPCCCVTTKHYLPCHGVLILN